MKVRVSLSMCDPLKGDIMVRRGPYIYIRNKKEPRRNTRQKCFKGKK